MSPLFCSVIGSMSLLCLLTDAHQHLKGSFPAPSNPSLQVFASFYHFFCSCNISVSSIKNLAFTITTFGVMRKQMVRCCPFIYVRYQMRSLIVKDHKRSDLDVSSYPLCLLKAPCHRHPCNSGLRMPGG